MNSATQQLGIFGENWVVDYLARKGYKPEVSPRFFEEGYDLKIKGMPVEVKIARKTYRKVNGKYFSRWQWYIHPTSHNQQDWLLILLAIDNAGHIWPYILPGNVLQGRTHIQLTSHPARYSGWLARFLNEWAWIDYLVHQVYRSNGPLYDQWEGMVAA